MRNILLFFPFFTQLISSDQQSFYLGQNFPLSPCDNQTTKLCMEVRITKPSNWTTGESEGVVYEGDSVEVTCYPSSTNFSTSILLGKDRGLFDRMNYSAVQIDGRNASRYFFPADSSNFNIYYCWEGVPFLMNDMENTPFLVMKVQKPYLKNIHHENQTLENGRSGILECEIDGYPTPTYKWFKNGTEITIGNSTSSRILTIENVHWNDGGIYNCTAINRAGFASQSVRVEIVKSRRSIEIMEDSKIITRLAIGFIPEPNFLNKPSGHIEVKITKSQNWEIGETEGEVYEGDTIEVTCYGKEYETILPHELYLQIGNDTRALSYETSYVNKRTITKYSVVATHLNSGEYTCVFFPETIRRLRKQLVNVIRTQRPYKVHFVPIGKRTLEYGKTEQIECEIEAGFPPPIYEWKKDKASIENAANSKILKIEDVKESDAGKYSCQASNRAGTDSYTIDVKVIGVRNGEMVNQTSSKLSLNSLVIIFLLLVVVLILAIHLCKNSGIKYFNVQSDENSQISKLPPDMRFKFENLKIMEKLGDGNFGKVHAGILDMNQTLSLNVAIKSPKNEGDIFQIGMLKEEYEIMKGIRLHPNILTLIGSVHDPNNTTISHIVFELCELGSLCDYLRLRKYHTSYLINQKNSDLEANTVWNDHNEMLAEQLSFAYQIARGMEFLSSINCVHRDLAARNVLLKSNKVCRIADFGLTRLHENNDYYRARYQTEVPVRWMSIESIKEGKYTEKSDVWAFGIVLFEIFSLGEKPYPNIGSDEIVKYILDGNINEKPEKCHPKIYELMKKCWRKNPRRRPSFSECSNFFKNCIKCNFPSMYISLQNLMESEAVAQQSIGNVSC